MKKKWKIALALFYTIVPIVGIKYGLIDSEQEGPYMVIYNCLLFPVLFYTLNSFYDRPSLSLGVKDLTKIRFSMFGIHFLTELLLIGLIYYTAMIGGKESHYIGHIFLLLLIFVLVHFTVVNNHITKVLIDLDIMINTVRFSQGNFKWHEACFLSSVGMATIETDEIKASINSHGHISVQKYPRTPGDTMEEVEENLKTKHKWEPVSPKTDVPGLKFGRSEQ